VEKAVYWLRLINKSALVPIEIVSPIYQEGEELTKIIDKSAVTAKMKK